MAAILISKGWLSVNVFYTESDVKSNQSSTWVRVICEYDFERLTITRTIEGDRKKSYPIEVQDSRITVSSMVPKRYGKSNEFERIWKPATKLIQDEYNKWLSGKMLEDSVV